jgi:hypothetical protein
MWMKYRRLFRIIVILVIMLVLFLLTYDAGAAALFAP